MISSVSCIYVRHCFMGTSSYIGPVLCPNRHGARARKCVGEIRVAVSIEPEVGGEGIASSQGKTNTNEGKGEKQRWIARLILRVPLWGLTCLTSGKFRQNGG